MRLHPVDTCANTLRERHVFWTAPRRRRHAHWRTGGEGRRNRPGRLGPQPRGAVLLWRLKHPAIPLRNLLKTRLKRRGRSGGRDRFSNGHWRRPRRRRGGRRLTRSRLEDAAMPLRNLLKTRLKRRGGSWRYHVAALLVAPGKRGEGLRRGHGTLARCHIRSRGSRFLLGGKPSPDRIPRFRIGTGDKPR